MGGAVQFNQRKDDALQSELRELVEAAGMFLLEYALSRHRGSVQLKVVLYRETVLGLEDCSRVHRVLQTRLETEYPDLEVYLEVSSPGIDRLIKDASEFLLYRGRGVRCYSTEKSDWVAGIVVDADSEKLVLRTKEASVELPYSTIAKARLDYSLEVGKE